MAEYELHLKELRSLYSPFPFIFNEQVQVGDLAIAAATRDDIGDVLKDCTFGQVFLSVCVQLCC